MCAVAVLGFGAGTAGFGALEGWEIQGSSSPTVKERATVIDTNGNLHDSNLFNEMINYTTTYKADITTVPTVPATLGALLNVILLTSINLVTVPNDYVIMTLTGHQHAANAHDGTAREILHGITLDAGFGVTDFFGETLGLVAAKQSASVTIACDHIDVLTETGGQFVGENFNARIEGDITYAGLPTTIAASEVFLTGGWDITSRADVLELANTTFKLTTATLIKRLTLA